MTRQEIAEIKKLLTPKKCSITRICGCYVDGDKNKKAEFGQAFLNLPEEEMFKYFEILRKTLSGAVGKNLTTLEFPLSSEETGGAQNFLLRLRDSRLKDRILLEEFYDRIIDSYEYVGNYLILAVHDAYDVPGRTLDGLAMEDASEEVYEYILACICPVELSKPGLSYHAAENAFHNRVRDWVVGLPEAGFLFPAFCDRSADIHNVLYYSKDPEDRKDALAERLFECPLPLSADSQKETFQALVEESLGEDCAFETVKTIHEKLNQMAEEHKDEPQPLALDKNEVRTILADSGVCGERLARFERQYDETAGESASLLVNNVTNGRSFEVKTPDVVIKVNPERTDLIETKIVDGRECLVVGLDGGVTVNGIAVRPARRKEQPGPPSEAL